MKKKSSNELLAERIATDLLTVYYYKGKKVGTRMQIMLDEHKDGAEINLGGRNKSSIVGVIMEHLEEEK